MTLIKISLSCRKDYGNAYCLGVTFCDFGSRQYRDAAFFEKGSSLFEVAFLLRRMASNLIDYALTLP